MKHKKKNYFFVFLILFLVGVAAIGYFFLKNNQKPGEYDEFARCISESGAKMYGTWWCTHCNAQKEMFDSSWKVMVDLGGYVECSNSDRTQTQICAEEGIRAYPTWRFPDGTESTGKKDFYTLSQKTGCNL